MWVGYVQIMTVDFLQRDTTQSAVLPWQDGKSARLTVCLQRSGIVII